MGLSIGSRVTNSRHVVKGSSKHDAIVKARGMRVTVLFRERNRKRRENAKEINRPKKTNDIGNRLLRTPSS